jgi:hypothetical protein
MGARDEQPSGRMGGSIAIANFAINGDRDSTGREPFQRALQN